MANHTLVMAGLLLASLGGCAVGPDFKKPMFDAPERFARAEGVDIARTSASDSDPGEFWRSLHDPILSSLIDRALSGNLDLRASLARYDASQALLRESRFNQLPVVTANGEVGHQRVAADQSYGYPRSADLHSVGLSASWELDLFGRVRREVEARRADSQAQADALRGLQVSIVGEIASTYADLRGRQQQLRVARANCNNQRETLRIVEARLKVGRGDDFDLLRTRAQLEATLSRVPPLEAQIAFDQHRLAVLAGQSPEALIEQLDDDAPLPELPPAIEPGTPANLLRRRPDVAEAEEHLHAATARIGVATADLFPRLTLSGMLGSFAFGAGSLFGSSAESNLVALGVDWSFLDVGRVRARIDASDAEAAAALAHYQRTVLLALEDTENALIRVTRTRMEDAHLARAAADGVESARLARKRYQAGAIGLYEVLDAERARLAAEDAHAEARARSVKATVLLYKALAGGWPQHFPARPSRVAAANQ
jgi:outer membrane protein, multidrug efflux system